MSISERVKRLSTALRMCSHIMLGFFLASFLEGHYGKAAAGAAGCFVANVGLAQVNKWAANRKAQVKANAAAACGKEKSQWRESQSTSRK